MILPESLIWAIGADGCCIVKIFCSEDIKEEIASQFHELFNEEYEKVMDLIEEDDGDCYEKDEELNPFLGDKMTEDGILFQFDALAMYCADGDIIAQYDAGEALRAALDRLMEEYPMIRYEGYIGYCWSDIHGGEVCQYEISSEDVESTDKDIQNYIRKTLGLALLDDDAWDRLEEHLQYVEQDELQRILEAFQLFSDWIPEDAKEKILNT